MSVEDSDTLEIRLRTILPEQYQDCYEDVQPVSMGSAGLKYGSDGKVAWDEIWGSFCDLAMAGGPPHKGALLEPGSNADIDANPGSYSEVAGEICRGICMVSDLTASPSPVPGWICVNCGSQTMAEWLVRAIVMENVSARSDGMVLYLPAGPDYRIAKEIKNVITAFAKTSHYWLEHMLPERHRAIASLFSRMAATSPLLQPALPGFGFHWEPHQVLCCSIAETVSSAIGLRASAHRYTGWLGIECPDAGAAIWMMRALVASNILSRREGTTLFLPVSPASDPDGAGVGQRLLQVYGFAAERAVL